MVVVPNAEIEFDTRMIGRRALCSLFVALCVAFNESRQ
jgi:hypothetical protein